MQIHLKGCTTDKQIFLIFLFGTFFIFLFSNDGHRSTFDESIAEEQAIRIATFESHPLYEPGESRLRFEYPTLFPNPKGPICQNAILCSDAYIGHSLTESIFIFLNNNLQFVTYSTLILDVEDFNDPHYVWWRNTYNPDVVFMEIFYGPVFASLSVAVFFLLSRSYDFSKNNSIVLTLVFAFSSLIWSYSQTSLNSVPVLFFVLLGFLLFKKFQKTYSLSNLTLCGIFLGFAFLTRPDAVFFIIPIYGLFLFQLKNGSDKIKTFILFSIPLVSSYLIYLYVNFIRFGSTSYSSVIDTTSRITPHSSEFLEFFQHVFGLLLSPGVGLFIFCPICLTIFFSFPDFFKRNKLECILFTVIFLWFLFYYSSISTWHGLVGWGPRYLLPVIPFLILPLGASLEKRHHIGFRFVLISLAGIGVFFNIAYLIQDVSWFVWGQMGSQKHGLYAIGGKHPLRLNPLVMWTFEYSQLTHSIRMATSYLQTDLYFLKLLGSGLYSLLIGAVSSIFGYLLYRSYVVNKPKIFE